MSRKVTLKEARKRFSNFVISPDPEGYRATMPGWPPSGIGRPARRTAFRIQKEAPPRAGGRAAVRRGTAPSPPQVSPTQPRLTAR
jgi:hypothetical protein